MKAKELKYYPNWPFDVHFPGVEDVDIKIDPPNWFSIHVDNSIINDTKMRIHLNEKLLEPINISVRKVPTKIQIDWEFNGKEERN